MAELSSQTVPSMYSVVERITPERAQDILSKNENIRRLNRRYILSLVPAMKEDRFPLHHQGIAFDVDGRLRDGFHRLSAVILAGVPVDFYVTYNVPREAVLHMDEQMRRHAADSLRVAGLGTYSRKLIATARSFLYPPNKGWHGLRTKEELLTVLQKYSDGLRFSDDNLKPTAETRRLSVITSEIRALVARAFYYVDRGRLLEFCHILCTGETTDPDQQRVVLRLRDCLSNKHKAVEGTGKALHIVRYCKAQTALRHFLEGTCPKVLYSTKEDLYPVKSV